MTFDSNVWEKVVCPDRYPDDQQNQSLRSVNAAIRSGRVAGHLSETFATIEAHERGRRGSFYASRELPLSIRDDPSARFSFTIDIGGGSDGHPGLNIIQAERFEQALRLGFKVLPVSRLGTTRPMDTDRQDVLIGLTSEQEANIWPLLQTIDDVSEAIEFRGVGFAPLKTLARQIQQRLGIDFGAAWYDGLDRPRDASEAKKIGKAFAEWADGDSIALHIAYGLEVFCTNDLGRGARKSILNTENRAWLTSTYGVRFMSLEELAEQCA